MIEHPKLFKKDSKGTVREWSVYSISDKVVVRHGVQGGKIQERITKCKPKNLGRANETSPEVQAVIEAKAKWVKQLERECYVEDLSHHPVYVQPMLARDATKVGHQIKWHNTIYGQAKLDGVRVLHIPGKGLQSRKGLIYEPMSFLDEPLCLLREELGLSDSQWFDGEVFKMGLPLNRILGAARKTNKLTPSLCIHIFDIACREQISYTQRRRMLAKVSAKLPNIAVVPSFVLLQSGVDEQHNRFVAEGFEGLMIKDGSGFYGFGERSDTLFKYKKFKEEEYEITDVVEDKDGQGILVYTMRNGNTFKARSRGTNEYRTAQLVNKPYYIGKQGTVRFFDYTEFGIPQFPITVAIGQDK